MKHFTLTIALLFSVFFLGNTSFANTNDGSNNKRNNFKKGIFKWNNDNGSTHAPKRGKPIKGHNQ